jgi:DNA-binding transcriptional ArsR family regulator
MKPVEIQFSLNLEALSAPQCRRIVEALIKGPHTFEELSKSSKLTPASIIKHLEILVGAGLVKLRNRDGVKEAHLQKSKFKPTVEWFSKLNN